MISDVSDDSDSDSDNDSDAHNDSDDPDFEIDTTEGRAEQRRATLAKAKEIIKFVTEHPTYKFKTLQHKFSVSHLPDKRSLDRMREIVQRNGTAKQKYAKINDAVQTQFETARKEFRPVHDATLQKWAFEEARSIGNQ